VTLDQKIKRIAQQARKLAGTADRPIARRNARARVLSALRAVRAHVDAEFPAIVSREGVKRLTIEGRRARLKRQGFVHLASGVEMYALAKVPVRTITVRNSGDLRWREHYVPRWAVTLNYTSVTQLRAFAKDRSLRDAALAEHALMNS